MEEQEGTVLLVLEEMAVEVKVIQEGLLEQLIVAAVEAVVLVVEELHRHHILDFLVVQVLSLFDMCIQQQLIQKFTS